MNPNQFKNKTKCDDCEKTEQVSKVSECICQFLKSKEVNWLGRNVHFQTIQDSNMFHDNNRLMMTLMTEFGKSRVLSRQSALDLVILLPQISHLRLIYDTSEDGMSPTDFHCCCDGKIHTLVVIQAENGIIA